MPEVGGTFGRTEERERTGEKLADRVKRAGTRGAEPGLQFREGEFDRVEVRTIGRQKLQRGSCPFDGRSDVRLLVDAEIVEDDDVARMEGRDQDLFDVGQKAGRVDRAIEDPGSGETVETQRGEDRVRLPVAERRMIDEPLAAETPPVATQQIGRDATFIKKHEPRGVQGRDRRPPVGPGDDDVRSTLFSRVYRFF